MSESTDRIASELAAATSAKKCHACGCFQDAVVALRQTELASSLTAPLSKASEVFIEPRYDCLGCEICWPANVLNIAADLVDLPTGAGCPTETPRPTDGWPTLPGDYQVIRFTAPVAVCTLHSKKLLGEIARADRKDCLSPAHCRPRTWASSASSRTSCPTRICVSWCCAATTRRVPSAIFRVSP